jgi:hypothetical protein
MDIRIDQNVLNRYPSLHIVKSENVVTVKLDGASNSDFLFPLNLPLVDLDKISWEEIDRIGKAGLARTYFALGATKTDHMKNGFDAVYQIMDFDHDDLADGSGKAPISWDMKGLYKDEIPMKKNGESCYWGTSDSRVWLNDDFFNNMSDELQTIVKPVWKYTANENGEIVKSVDSVWLKSEQELYGRSFYGTPGEGHWYALYAKENTPYFKLNVNGDKDWNWLRSVNSSYTTYFCRVYTDGSANSSYSRNSRGVAPAFSS